MSFLTKTLAKEALDEYSCGVHICINPDYLQWGNAICGLGDFKPNDVDKLADLLEEVSNQDNAFEESTEIKLSNKLLNIRLKKIRNEELSNNNRYIV